MDATVPQVCALFRDASVASPDPRAWRAAALERLDLVLAGPGEAEPQLLREALRESCGVILLDRGDERAGERVLAGRLAEEDGRPVVTRDQARQLERAGAILAACQELETPREEWALGLLGEQARALGPLLVAAGCPKASLRPLPPPRRAAGPGGAPAPAPAWPERLDLLVCQGDPAEGGVELPEALAGARRVALEAHQGDRVLPALLRAALDAGRSLPLEDAALAEVARALAELAGPEGLPPADDARLIDVLAPCAMTTLDPERDPQSYRDGLRRRRSPGWAALETALLEGRSRRPTLGLSDGEDPRVVSLARRLADEGLGAPWLLGDPFRLEARAKSLRIPLKGIRLVEPQRNRRRVGYGEQLLAEHGAALGLSGERAAALAGEPETFLALALAAGDLDGAVLRGEPVDPGPWRAALALLPRAPRCRALGLATLLAGGGRTLLLAEPLEPDELTAEELGGLALQAARLVRELLGQEPRVALLGAADCRVEGEGAAGRRAARARSLLKAWAPELHLDGPLRLPLALDAELQARAYPYATLGGVANAVLLTDRAGAAALRDAAASWAGMEALGAVVLGVEAPVAVASPTLAPEPLAFLAGAVAALAAARGRVGGEEDESTETPLPRRRDTVSLKAPVPQPTRRLGGGPESPAGER